MSVEDFILPWEQHKHPSRATFINSFAFLCSLALEEGFGTRQCPFPGWVQGVVAKADVSPVAGRGTASFLPLSCTQQLAHCTLACLLLSLKQLHKLRPHW